MIQTGKTQAKYFYGTTGFNVIILPTAHSKNIKSHNKVLLYGTVGNSAQCYLAAWMGGEFWGERIHVYVWLSSFAVHLKLSHCLLISYIP